jgi:hypothetical protein
VLFFVSVFRHSAKFLPSAEKNYSARVILPIKCLPSVILVKDFAECKMAKEDESDSDEFVLRIGFDVEGVRPPKY